MAKKKSSVSYGKNIFGIIIGIFAFNGAVSCLVLMGSQSSPQEMLVTGLIMLALAAFLIIFNSVKIHRKRQYAAYEKAMAAADKSDRATGTRPSPKPTRTTSNSSSGKNIDFINAVQRGRYFDEFFSNTYGSAELYVPIDYKNGDYYIKPEIEISYNKYTCKTQSQVDAFDECVVEAYEKEFNQMVAICEKWGVSYDISEPKVTTNIHHGEIL